MIAIILTLVASACASQTSPDDFTRVEIDHIVDKCGVARRPVYLNKGWVTIAAPAADDPAGICTLNEIKRAGKRHVSIVANALHAQPPAP